MRSEMSSSSLMTLQRFAITANSQSAGAASIDRSPAENVLLADAAIAAIQREQSCRWLRGAFKGSSRGFWP